jgi:hypothetical protein
MPVLHGRAGVMPRPILPLPHLRSLGRGHFGALARRAEEGKK